VPVFNTNTFLVSAEALRDLALDWTYLEVHKQVAGASAVQFERLIGEMTMAIRPRFVRVPREGRASRFLPAKIQGISGSPVHFEFAHEFDAPLDTVELAMMSPDLGGTMARGLDSIESIKVVEHELRDGVFRRVWRFQARAPLKLLSGREITRDMMTWDERATYRLEEHSGEWDVVPRAGIDPGATWRRHFQATGRYVLDPLRDGRTRRRVVGDFVVDLKVVGRVVERLALTELRKAYDAEAEALRALATLP
jgi:hypothetical protein